MFVCYLVVKTPTQGVLPHPLGFFPRPWGKRPHLRNILNINLLEKFYCYTFYDVLWFFYGNLCKISYY